MRSHLQGIFSLGLTGALALVAGCSSDQAGTIATGGAGTAGVSAAGQSGGGAAGSVSGGAAGSSGSVGVAGVGGTQGGAGGLAGAGGVTTGGAAGAAGSAGAGGSGGSDPAACKPEWQLCDGFEGAVPGAQGSDFDVVTFYTATVGVVADKAAHGTHSVHIVIPAHGNGDPDGTAGYIAETKTFPAMNNTFWGRMMVFFHPATMLPETHWANVQASGIKNDPNHDLLRVGGGNKAPGGMNTNQFPPDSFGYSQTQIIPVDKWSCWEWEMDGKEPQNTNVHFYIDEQEVSDVAVVNGKAVSDPSQIFIAPQFQRVELGWQFWNNDKNMHFTGGDLWLDDVVIDDQRIHCPGK